MANYYDYFQIYDENNIPQLDGFLNAQFASGIPGPTKCSALSLANKANRLVNISDRILKAYGEFVSGECPVAGGFTILPKTEIPGLSLIDPIFLNSAHSFQLSDPVSNIENKCGVIANTIEKDKYFLAANSFNWLLPSTRDTYLDQFPVKTDFNCNDAFKLGACVIGSTLAPELQKDMTPLGITLHESVIKYKDPIFQQYLYKNYLEPAKDITRKNNCNALTSKFCTGDKVVGNFCKAVLQKREPTIIDRSAVNDEEILKYCSTDIKNYDNENKDVCACFMGKNFTDTFVGQISGQSPLLAAALKVGGERCFLPNCIASTAIKRYSDDSATKCPDNQICLNDIKVTTSGGIMEVGNLGIVATCSNKSDTLVPSPVPSTPGGVVPPAGNTIINNILNLSMTNKIIIASIVGTILLLIIIVLII